MNLKKAPHFFWLQRRVIVVLVEAQDFYDVVDRATEQGRDLCREAADLVAFESAVAIGVETSSTV